jgi:hypothetical protein
LAIVIAAAIGLSPGDAAARASTCQREIVKASAKLLTVESRALERCHTRLLAGKTEPPCPDGKAAIAILKAEARTRRIIDRKCGGGDRSCDTTDDEPLDTVGWDIGLCPAMTGASCAFPIASCTDVAECITCLGGAAAASIHALSGVPTPPSSTNIQTITPLATPTTTATPSATLTPTPTPTSTTPPTCGNGMIDPGEACELLSLGCGALQVCLACLACVGL